MTLRSEALAAVLLALIAPAPGFPQSFTEVELESTLGAGLRVKVTETRDKARPEPRDGLLVEYLRVENTIDWAFFAKGGAADAKSRISFQGKIMSGHASTYELHIPKEAYEELRRSHRPLPHPFDPRTLPVGASALLRESSFHETGLAVAFREISAQASYRDSDGVAIGLEKLSSHKVRAVTGRFHDVLTSLFIGVGISSDVIELRLGSGKRVRKGFSTLRTAVFDLSTEEGQAAFNYFFLTGNMDRVQGRRGVERVGTVYKKTEKHEVYAAIAAGIGGLKVRLGGVSESLSGETERTVYDSGLVELEKSVRVDDNSITFKSSSRGGERLSHAYLVVLPSVDYETATRLSNLVRADAAEWSPPAGPESRARAYTRYDLQFTFSQKDLPLLRARAGKCLDQEWCKRALGDIRSRIPAVAYSTSYPRQAILPNALRLLRQLGDPAKTSFDHLVPSRLLASFLIWTAWEHMLVLESLRPRAVFGNGEPIPGRLLLVARGNVLTTTGFHCRNPLTYRIELCK